MACPAGSSGDARVILDPSPVLKRLIKDLLVMRLVLGLVPLALGDN
jgi:hypothetical protein